MPAGYSVAPLIKKSGITDEMKVQLIGQPNDYYKFLEKNISSQLCKKNDIPDFVHLFVKND